jgi:hypothetical protein
MVKSNKINATKTTDVNLIDRKQNKTKLLNNNLTIEERTLLDKFDKLTYEQKKNLKMVAEDEYKDCIHLLEKSYEAKIPITHKKYRVGSLETANRMIKEVNPKFLITLKYVETTANDYDRVIKVFSNIKDLLCTDTDYRLIHYIEFGEDRSMHSHCLISSTKGISETKQIEYFNKMLKRYKSDNKYGIANGRKSIHVKRFVPKVHPGYFNKDSKLSFLSIDLTNTDVC